MLGTVRLRTQSEHQWGASPWIYLSWESDGGTQHPSPRTFAQDPFYSCKSHLSLFFIPVVQLVCTSWDEWILEEKEEYLGIEPPGNSLCTVPRLVRPKNQFNNKLCRIRNVHKVHNVSRWLLAGFLPPLEGQNYACPSVLCKRPGGLSVEHLLPPLSQLRGYWSGEPVHNGDEGNLPPNNEIFHTPSSWLEKASTSCKKAVVWRQVSCFTTFESSGWASVWSIAAMGQQWREGTGAPCPSLPCFFLHPLFHTRVCSSGSPHVQHIIKWHPGGLRIFPILHLFSNLSLVEWASTPWTHLPALSSLPGHTCSGTLSSACCATAELQILDLGAGSEKLPFSLA